MVIIAYEGKTDEEFLNSLLDTYQLPKATYYNFEGKDNILNISHPYYDELEINIKKHPFDFNHQNFNELKQKLQNLFN